MNNVLPLEPPNFLVGPFEVYAVVVDHRFVPRLTAHKVGEHRTELILDGRFSSTFDNDDAYQAAWLIANALAIGEGYSHFTAETKDKPFAPIAREIQGL